MQRKFENAIAGLRPMLRVIPACALVVVAGACSSGADAGAANMADNVAMADSTPNTLTAEEKAGGWTLLFDGTDFNGWRGLGRDTVPTAFWKIDDGTIHKIADGDVPLQADGQPLNGSDLITDSTYENFDLVFDWKISSAGNSGVKYNVSEAMSTANPPGNAALGFEYQVLDDSLHPDAKLVTHRAGALYDMIPPNDQKNLNPVGEWNHSEIIFNGNHGEHWLNGQKIVEYDLGTAKFDSLLAASKYADIPGFADKRAGHIVLQDHVDEVWYRNMKIRVIQ